MIKRHFDPRLAIGATTAATIAAVHWWRHRHDGEGLGYVNGQPVVLQLVTINGKPVEVATAAAFAKMRDAARRDSLSLKVVSGFRTMAEQEHLYKCYLTGSCNSGNFAVPPGFSSHQSGRALDLNARAPGVYDWLRAHASRFEFFETVADEPWHWEYQPPMHG